jgi:hypothetical protein
VTLYLSWSALKTHEHCKQKAMLLRKGKKSPAQDIRGYFHGTVVDRVMRNWLDHPDPQPGVMVGMVDDMIINSQKEALESGDGVVRWKSRNDRAEMTEFCKELVVRLEPILYDLVLPYDYEPAKRFKTPIMIPHLDGSPTLIYLVGEMDLLVRDEKERWAIWDLKGTKNDSYWRQTVAQLVYYDLATHSMFGEYSSKAGLIQPMCEKRVMEIDINDQARADLMARIVSFAHDRWRNDFQPKESTGGCSWCPVKHACEKFTPISSPADRAMTLEAMNLAQIQHKQIDDLV